MPSPTVESQSSVSEATFLNSFEIEKPIRKVNNNYLFLKIFVGKFRKKNI